MEIAAESGLGTTLLGNLMVANRPLATPDGDGRLNHGDPQLLKPAVDARRTPERIRRGQLADQGAHVCRRTRTPGAVSALPAPEQTRAAPVPPNNCLWLDDMHGRPPAAPCLREPRPQHAVDVRERKGVGGASGSGPRSGVGARGSPGAARRTATSISGEPESTGSAQRRRRVACISEERQGAMRAPTSVPVTGATTVPSGA
jgi:hypothetical protein